MDTPTSRASGKIAVAEGAVDVAPQAEVELRPEPRVEPRQRVLPLPVVRLPRQAPVADPGELPDRHSSRSTK